MPVADVNVYEVLYEQACNIAELKLRGMANNHISEFFS